MWNLRARANWIDQYSESGKRYRISTSALHGSRIMARVKSYGDALEELRVPRRGQVRR
jgi:hypothetical protein